MYLYLKSPDEEMLSSLQPSWLKSLKRNIFKAGDFLGKCPVAAEKTLYLILVGAIH